MLQQEHKPPRKQQSHQRQRTPHVQDSQDPTQAGEVTDWEEVTGRRKKICREKRVSSRPDAIIVKTDNMSYADMLKRFKSSGEMQRVGEALNAITKTKDGHLRIVLSRGTNETENLQTAIKNIIGNEVSCTRLSDTSIIEIRDADEEATDDEILEAMQMRAGNNASIRIISKRKLDRGTQIITASIPTSKINMILSTRLRIGFVNCRVRRKIEAKKCFRCQGFGHTSADCINEERRNHCWQCGEVGHKLKDCKNEAKCLLCKEEATSDHPLGSYRCHAYKRALEAMKSNPNHDSIPPNKHK
ncbi:hypothetical protein QTP88_022384 [Uroleucon formosanum]